MATKEQVIALHKKHPDWPAPKIAKALDCQPGYVRATAQRNDITLPKGYHSNAGHEMAKLGAMAHRLGLTMADLERIASIKIMEAK